MEIKSYPDRDGKTDPADVRGACRQAAVVVVGLRHALTRLGAITPVTPEDQAKAERLVLPLGDLVLRQPGSFWPTLRPMTLKGEVSSLERPVMLVHHPLSGRADADSFHLDAGRLCVMLSRHRVACFVVSRAGVEELLVRYAPSGDRVLGLERDEEYEGWRAHLTLLRGLHQERRVVQVSRRGTAVCPGPEAMLSWQL